jgi:hypothetical protein
MQVNSGYHLLHCSQVDQFNIILQIVCIISKISLINAYIKIAIIENTKILYF